MKIPFVDDYKIMPSMPDDSSNKTKDKNAFFLEKAKHFFGKYANNACYYSGQDKRDSWIEARLYGEGIQPIEKYQNICCPLITRRVKCKPNDIGYVKGETHWMQTEVRTAWSDNWEHISWDNPNIYFRFRQRLIGMLESIDIATNIVATDRLSNDDKALIKARIQANTEQSEFVKMIKEELGVDISESANVENSGMGGMPSMPTTIEEFDLLNSVGAIKLMYEMEMEALVNYSMTASEWRKIKQKLVCDVIDFAHCVLKVYIDPISKKPKIRHVKSEDFLYDYAYHDDKRILSEAGEVRSMGVYDLRQYGLTPKDIQEINYRYSGYGTNNSEYRIDGNGFQRNSNTCVILDFEFISYEGEWVMLKKGDYGFKLFPQKNRATYNSTAEKTYINDIEPKWYKCKWVIGTDVVFDISPLRDVSLDEDELPNCGYIIHKVGERSITQNCISIIDDYCIDTYKLRLAKSKAAPAGFAIESTSANQITMGGEEMTIKEVLRAYTSLGSYVYSFPRDKNGTPMQGVGDPIKILEGGIGRLFNELASSLAYSENLIRSMTGIGEGVDGTNNPNMLVGTTQIALSSMSQIHQSIVTCISSVKTEASQRLSYMWEVYRMLTTVGAVDGTAIQDVIGELGSIVLNSTNELYVMKKWGCYFENVIDDTVKDSIREAASISLQSGKNGSPGITHADYMFITRCLSEGKLKAAEVYLSYRERKEKEYAAAVQQQNMEMNSKSSLEIEEAKALSEKEKIIHETDEKIRYEKAVHELKMKEIAATNRMKNNVDTR